LYGYEILRVEFPVACFIVILVFVEETTPEFPIVEVVPFSRRE
jgi:hypothetical protein